MLTNEADVEDVTQEVLLKVVRKVDTFRGEGELINWLDRVTVNACLLHRRTAARQKPSRLKQLAAERVLPRVGGAAPAADQAAQERETLQRIQWAVARLPAIYREVFVLAEVEELSGAAVSDLLRLTLPAVKSRLHRARRLLRDALTSYFGEWAETGSRRCVQA
jgi:RNA polymerase sigma-70 factor (ECF subfamily)